MIRLRKEGIMNKEALKAIGSEVLLLLAMCVLTAAAMAGQMAGRKHLGHHSSIIFAGENYKYNYLIYFIVLAAFCAAVWFAYRFILKKHIGGLFKAHAGYTIAYILLPIVFLFLTVLALAIVAVLILGLGDQMFPEALFLITLFGIPFANTVFVIVMYIWERTHAA